MAWNRVAVVGAGRLGSLHAQKLAAEPRAELVAVADPVAETRQRVAAARTTPEPGVVAGQSSSPRGVTFLCNPRGELPIIDGWEPLAASPASQE